MPHITQQPLWRPAEITRLVTSVTRVFCVAALRDGGNNHRLTANSLARREHLLELTINRQEFLM